MNENDKDVICKVCKRPTGIKRHIRHVIHKVGMVCRFCQKTL